MAGRTSWITRLIAGTCFLALLGSWAPHVHEGSHSTSVGPPRAASMVSSQPDAAPFALSSDDAHEEHSATAALADATCAFCRSKDQREEARPTPFEQSFSLIQPATGYADSIERHASVLFAQLRPARAPPTELLA